MTFENSPSKVAAADQRLRNFTSAEVVISAEDTDFPLARLLVSN